MREAEVAAIVDEVARDILTGRQPATNAILARIASKAKADEQRAKWSQAKGGQPKAKAAPAKAPPPTKPATEAAGKVDYRAVLDAELDELWGD
jgi:hypothetical protein